MNIWNHNRRKAQQAARYDVAAELLAFLEQMKQQYAGVQKLPSCSKEEFVLMLIGVGLLRKVPGMRPTLSMDFDQLVENQGAVRTHCKTVYGITDKESFLEFAQQEYITHGEYQQFVTFWEGNPCFDVNQLQPGPRHLFEACRDFARLLAPIAGRQGFAAFDVSQQLALWRVGYAAGWLTEEEFWEKALPAADRAARQFNSWMAYAASYLCGACYDLFRGQMRDTGAVDKIMMQEYVELNTRLMERLFSGQEFWAGHGWYVKPAKQYKLSAQQMRSLLVDYQGGERVACLASDRITVDGAPAGYLYREKPLDLPGVPDSGWRIFAGDEDQQYLDNPEHFEFYHLNTLCNYDPSILPLLNAAEGTAFQRAEDGSWRARPLS